MAIYTEYGRYLKAKAFKEYLESTNDGVYMLLGLGCPVWDKSLSSDIQMPIAPYNSSIISDSVPNNQFKDDSIKLRFDTANEENSNMKAYLECVGDLVPVFPGIWTPSSDTTSIVGGANPSNFNQYKITSSGSSYTLVNTSGTTTTVSLPSDTIDNYTKRQYFGEMVLRGKNDKIINPVGLLGAVKCDISYVMDIGQESDNIYEGKENQFWYGDRYWQVCSIEEYANYNRDLLDTSTVKLPHHLLFTAVINPRSLCADLAIDQCLVPMQIALFAKKKVENMTSQKYYRVSENLFNFGQYTKQEIESAKSNQPILDSLGKEGADEDDADKRNNRFLNFTVKCKDATHEWPEGDFEFLLNDYIKGSPRQPHTVDRIGYIVGF